MKFNRRRDSVAHVALHPSAEAGIRLIKPSFSETMTVTANRLPNFIVVGAAKAGTTWIQACLQEHPDVFVPKEGEVDFFSFYYHRGLSWYSRFFDSASPQAICGEKSPSYMVTPEAAQRINHHVPDAKLIFVLRNPIDRAYSHYCMHARVGAVSKDIEMELRGGTRIVDEGLYYTHLSRYIDLFGRDKILCLLYEDLKNDPRTFIRDVYAFIGVSSEFEPPSLFERHHAKKTLPRFTQVNRLFANAAKRLAGSGKLGSALDEKLRAAGIDRSLRMINPRATYPEISPNKKRFLAEYYASDIEKLSDLLHRDLYEPWVGRYLNVSIPVPA